MYHVECHKQAFHPRCDVCSAFLPAQPDGLIRFHHAPFWGLRFCPGHEADGTPRCLACNRLQPHGDRRTSCCLVGDPCYAEHLFCHEMHLPLRRPWLSLMRQSLKRGTASFFHPAKGCVMHAAYLRAS